MSCTMYICKESCTMYTTFMVQMVSLREIEKQNEKKKKEKKTALFYPFINDGESSSKCVVLGFS